MIDLRGNMCAHRRSNGLGSTMALTDADGDVVNTYDYDVFGGIRDSSGAQPNEFRFTGEQWDDATSLQYLRARYYDPSVGRFLSEDPLSAGNLYAYVANNPLVYVDPLGLCHEYLGYDQVCRLVHELTVRQEFSGEWKVLVGELGSGEAGGSATFSLQVHYTSSESGSRTSLSVNRDGSDKVAAYEAKVFYYGGQRANIRLRPCGPRDLCTPGTTVISGEIKEGHSMGQPTQVELLLSRTPGNEGTWISSTRLRLDLRTGETSQNTCDPLAARYFNAEVCH
jgi:RHS repeat-associated protein